MATFTLPKLLEQSAFKVGALAVGQPLSAEDLEALTLASTALFDQLEEDEIVTFANTNEIPAALAPYLASLIANLVGPSYGLPFSADAKQVNEAIIRRIVRAHATYEQQTPDYF
jgi:hypothetical protein